AAVGPGGGGVARAVRVGGRVHRRDAGRDPEPAAFRVGAAHAGRSGAGANRTCVGGIDRAARGRSRVAENRGRCPLGSRAPARRAEPGVVTKTSIGALVFEAAVIAALWMLGQWFSS